MASKIPHPSQLNPVDADFWPLLKDAIDNPALATTNAAGAMPTERYLSTQDQNWAEADIFGREYLYAWLVKLMAGTTPVIDLAGDSTTSGTGVGDPNYLLEALITNFMTASYPAVTVYNDGVSGTTTVQWVSTYLTAQIARAPDLMIIRYGLNDAANGLATFASALRAGLAQIRATRSVSQTAILLMTPNSTNDTPNSRDETWHLAINSVIRQAARDYLCCFADTYTFCRDSANAAPWMDNPYGDGRHIHPDQHENLLIASLIKETIYPYGIESMLRAWFATGTTSSRMFFDGGQISVNRNTRTGGVVNAGLGSAAISITPSAAGGTITLWTSNGTGGGISNWVVLGPGGNLTLAGRPIYANNAAALAGGLTAGMTYRTNGDPDLLCVVH